MNDVVRLTIQVIVSLGIIYGGLWWMWRLPGKPILDSAAAPILALGSVWLGLGAVGTAIWLWWTSVPDVWVVIVVGLYSAALATGGFCLWIYRATPAESMTDEILMQRLQARVGIALGLLAVALWYVFILTHKTVLTPVGPGG